MNGLLIEQTVVEVAESVEDVATYMYVVVYALSLEILHASGSSGNHKLGTAVEILECGGSVFGILIIA